jgi:hypothetical protein
MEKNVYLYVDINHVKSGGHKSYVSLGRNILWSSVTSSISYEICMGRFILFSVITNIYNKKTKGPTLMEKVFFDN